MKLLTLLLLLISICVVAGESMSCMDDSDCHQCYRCERKETGKGRECVQVKPFTDPLHHCGIYCNSKLVCGNDPICVMKTLPSCECDWHTGVCTDLEDHYHEHHHVILFAIVFFLIAVLFYKTSRRTKKKRDLEPVCPFFGDTKKST